jgi:hypothetical protein
MATNDRSFLIEAFSIGEAAREYLSQAPDGTVMAAFSKAVYFRTGRGDLFWQTSSDAAMHRRAILTASDLPKVRVGESYSVSRHQLSFASGYHLDYGPAEVWSEPMADDRRAVQLADLRCLVRAILVRIQDWSGPAGMDCLIPSGLGFMLDRDPSVIATTGSVYMARSWPVLRSIIGAIRRHNFKELMTCSTDLVGLGEGLTPSGDDFLGGLFFCLNLLKRCHAKDLDLSQWNYSGFIQNCQSQTNVISYTLLKDHASGHGVEALHRMAKNLLEGQRVEQALTPAMQLVCIGHSTGWDILTGFLTGFSILFVG